MSNSHYLPDNIKFKCRAMMFIDGENLAIRYKNILGEHESQNYVKYLENVYVWSKYANIYGHRNCEVIRKYYYTAVQGDDLKIEDVENDIKELGIEAPRVFKKPKNKSTKRVDITLATEMLTHAHRKNFDIAILVAGDEDYVPLVKAIREEGCRVVVWFFNNGLSKHLKKEADHFFDISYFLTKPEEDVRMYYQSQ